MPATPEAYIVFTTANTPLSWLIRLRTGSVASHCGVLVRTPGQPDTVYQAGGGGVGYGSLSLYLGAKRRIVKVLRVGRKGESSPDASAGVMWAKSVQGAAYGLMPDIELSLGLSANWAKGQYNCSEFAAKFMLAMIPWAHWLGQIRADAGVTPQELIVSMQAAGCEDVSAQFGVKLAPPAKRLFRGNL